MTQAKIKQAFFTHFLRMNLFNTEIFAGLADAANRAIRCVEGKRCVLLAVVTALCLIFVVTTVPGAVISSPISKIGWDYIVYCLVFWKHNIPKFFLTAAFFMAICFKQPLRSLVGATPLDRDVLREHEFFNRIIFRLSFVLAWVCLPPLLFLLCPSYFLFDTSYYGLGELFASIALVASLLLAIKPPKAVDTVPRLGVYSFGIPTSFDSGTMGTVAREVEKEIDFFSRMRRTASLTTRIRDYLLRGNGETAWQGMPSIFDLLGEFLGVSQKSILLHENTTAIVRHVLECLALTADDYLVSCDLSYGSVVDVCTEVAREAKCKNEVVELANAEAFDSANVVSGFVKAIESLLAKSKSGARSRVVVVIHHVCHRSGAVIDIAALRSQLGPIISKKRAKLIFLVDGAQAVGNIEVNKAETRSTDGTEAQKTKKSVLEISDFYAFSGHKWLLTKPAIGILILNEELLRTTLQRQSDATCSAIYKTNRPFSTYSEPNDDTMPTISVDAHLCLGVMLLELYKIGQSNIAAHNRKLAHCFVTRVSVWTSEFRPIIRQPQSGIVVVRTKYAKRLKILLEQRGLFCQAIDEISLRLCFHYMISEEDVDEAVYIFCEVVELTGANNPSLNALELPERNSQTEERQRHSQAVPFGRIAKVKQEVRQAKQNVKKR